MNGFGIGGVFLKLVSVCWGWWRKGFKVVERAKSWHGVESGLNSWICSRAESQCMRCFFVFCAMGPEKGCCSGLCERVVVRSIMFP